MFLQQIDDTEALESEFVIGQEDQLMINKRRACTPIDRSEKGLVETEQSIEDLVFEGEDGFIPQEVETRSREIHGPTEPSSDGNDNQDVVREIDETRSEWSVESNDDINKDQQGHADSDRRITRSMTRTQAMHDLTQI